MIWEIIGWVGTALLKKVYQLAFTNIKTCGSFLHTLDEIMQNQNTDMHH